MLYKEIPFETHITINNLELSRRIDFIDFCNTIDAKPIIIELSKGEFINQPMISKILYSNNIDEILLTSNELSKALAAKAFIVNRIKIEIPAKYSFLFESYTTSFEKYFEYHCKIDFIKIEHLKELCNKHNVHLSLNSLSKESNKRFITLREFGTKTEFDDRIDILTKDLEIGNWIIFKQESEYCIYDNNNLLDNGWFH